MRTRTKTTSINILFCAFLLAPFLTAAAAVAVAAMAQPPKSSQSDAEAAYVCNFAKFVRWPQAAAGTPLTICVLNENPFGDTLQHLAANQSISGHPLQVRTVAGLQEAQSCSVLFLPGHDEVQRNRVLAALHGKPVLTVSDSPAFLESGGIVQFVLLEGRVRFSVNLKEANEDGLEISSELLKVAVGVMGKPLPEAPK